MKATETYYENKIAKLETTISRVRKIAEDWTNVGVPMVPAKVILQILDGVEDIDWKNL